MRGAARGAARGQRWGVARAGAAAMGKKQKNRSEERWGIRENSLPLPGPAAGTPAPGRPWRRDTAHTALSQAPGPAGARGLIAGGARQARLGPAVHVFVPERGGGSISSWKIAA